MILLTSIAVVAIFSNDARALGREGAIRGAASPTLPAPGLAESAGAYLRSLPLSLPPGPGGLTPTVALRYSSSGSDGLVGLGWSLGFESIGCSTRFGSPDYADCAHFALNGALLDGPHPDSSLASADRYYPIEETYERVRRLANGSWEVTATDGGRRIYGDTPDSRVRLGHAADASGAPIVRWLLSRIVDAFGNEIAYTYTQSIDPSGRVEAVLPSTVSWAEGTRRLSFHYEERPDVVDRFAGGHRDRLTRRVREIRVESGSPLRIHHRLELGYSAPGDYTTARSRLVSVQRFGTDCASPFQLSRRPSEAGCAGLPKETFEYSDSDEGIAAAGGAQFPASSDLSGFPQPILDAIAPASVDSFGNAFPGNYGFVWGDVDGDGLDDFLTGYCPSGAFPCAGPHEGLATFAVHLNTGSGWDPLPDPDWTAALAALRFDAPSLKLARNPYAEDFGLNQGSAPYCIVEPDTYESTVLFGNSAKWYYPSPPIAFEDGPEPEIFHVREFPAPSAFRSVDLNGDGRSDLIMSVRVGGAWKKAIEAELAPGDGHCLAPVAEQTYHESTATIVFLNTGDPTTGGWERAPHLETSLPPFMAVEFQDHVSSGHCNSMGLHGNEDGPWDPPGFGLPLEYDGYCRGLIDFDAQFVELNGDGRPDVLVAVPEDPRFLVQERLDHAFGGPAFGACPTGPMHGDENLRIGDGTGQSIRCHNPAKTRAYVQERDAAGVYRWVAAPSFDFESAAPGAPAHHVHIAYVNLTWLSYQTYTHPQNHDGGFHVSDDGVRFVDLNADGLTDVVWRDPHFDPDTPSGRPFDPFEQMDPGAAQNWYHGGGPAVPMGVLLNTGDGWCASWVASECPDAGGYVPPASIALVGAGLSPSTANVWTRYTAGALGAGSSGLVFSELNGDGLVDVVQLGADPRSWIQSPGTPGGRWVEDPRFAPPSDAMVGVNLNGNRVVDWFGPSRVGIDASSLPDLLARHDNGRGAITRIAYVEAPAQRDAALEADARAEATTRPTAGGTDARAITRWPAAPVVARIEEERPNYLRPDASGSPSAVTAVRLFRYARPRWDPELERSMGFGLVREVQPDGSRVDTYAEQSVGLSGRVRKRLRFDAAGMPVAWEERLHDVVLAHPGSGPRSYTGRTLETTTRNEYGAAFGDRVGAETIVRYRFAPPNDPPGTPPGYPYPFVFGIEIDRPSGLLRRERVPVEPDETHGLVGLVASTAERDAADGALSHVATTYWTTAEGVPTDRVERVSRDVFDRADGIVDGVEVVAFTYDARGNLASRTIDPGGLDRRTRYCYDGDADCAFGHGSRSLVVATTNALGITATVALHPVFAQPVRVDPGWSDLPAMAFEYDAFGRIEAELVTPTGAVPGAGEDVLLASTEYDDSAPPAITRMAYTDGPGSQAVVTRTIGDGAGGTWKSIGLHDGVPARALGTARAVDPQTRTIRETMPSACADDRCGALTGAEPGGSERAFDVLGRPERSLGPDGGLALYEYDGAPIVAGVPGYTFGRSLDVTRTKDPGGGLRREYADGDRVLRLEVCSNTADPASLPSSPCTSPEVTQYAWAPTGELARIFDPMASSAGDFSFPSAHAIGFAFDSLGRVVSADEPNAGPVTTTYDAAGQIASTTNARGQTRTRIYDEIGRLKRMDVPDGEVDVHRIHRAGELHLHREFAIGVYTNGYDHDRLGRLRKTSVGRIGSMSTVYDYDNLGRPRRIHHPIRNGGVRSATVYEYDGPFVVRVCDPGDGSFDCDSLGSRDYVSNVEYDEAWRPARIEMPNGVRTIEYDAATHRRTLDRFDSGPAGAYFVERRYEDPAGGSGYDLRGNLRHLQMTSSLSDLDGSQTFEYDAQNRLAFWTPEAATGDGSRHAYAYDALGNLAIRKDRSQLYRIGTESNQVQSVDGGATTYAYDADGNMIRKDGPDGATHYTYDSASRLVCAGASAGGCDRLEVTYDLDGRRIAEVSNGATIRRFAGPGFVHTEGLAQERQTLIDVRLHDEVIAVKRLYGGEIVGADPPLDPDLPWLLWSGGAIAMGLLVVGVSLRSSRREPILPVAAHATLVVVVSSGLVLPDVARAGGRAIVAAVAYEWTLSDAVGSTAISLDEHGDRLGQTVMEPFGEVHRRVGMHARPRYAGHAEERRAGLVYMQARWMDPESGRFASIDPVIASVSRPSSMNAYAYAENNPVSIHDPTGTVGEDAQAAEAGVEEIVVWGDRASVGIGLVGGTRYTAPISSGFMGTGSGGSAAGLGFAGASGSPGVGGRAPVQTPETSHGVNVEIENPWEGVEEMTVEGDYTPGLMERFWSGLLGGFGRWMGRGADALGDLIQGSIAILAGLVIMPAAIAIGGLLAAPIFLAFGRGADLRTFFRTGIDASVSVFHLGRGVSTMGLRRLTSYYTGTWYTPTDHPDATVRFDGYLSGGGAPNGGASE